MTLQSNIDLSQTWQSLIFCSHLLLKTPREFSSLYKKNNELNGKNVKSFIITAHRHKSWYWNNMYVIRYKQIAI